MSALERKEGGPPPNSGKSPGGLPRTTGPSGGE
eukprot:CAMPEP_0183547930 /NCGR_PEP_ID=MMETSP0371-20130417/57698_1 /TAXON_ID=268820 /ORGANISM="Peridinium aciculiferum, Strain PAER-2" /LENGTH=32 /DNA_ID= /DNA_START= /DNA_END= /DNA_ORIENTATION=